MLVTVCDNLSFNDSEQQSPTLAAPNKSLVCVCSCPLGESDSSPFAGRFLESKRLQTCMHNAKCPLSRS